MRNPHWALLVVLLAMANVVAADDQTGDWSKQHVDELLTIYRDIHSLQNCPSARNGRQPSWRTN